MSSGAALMILDLLTRSFCIRVRAIANEGFDVLRLTMALLQPAKLNMMIILKEE